MAEEEGKANQKPQEKKPKFVLDISPKKDKYGNEVKGTEDPHVVSDSIRKKLLTEEPEDD